MRQHQKVILTVSSIQKIEWFLNSFLPKWHWGGQTFCSFLNSIPAKEMKKYAEQEVDPGDSFQEVNAHLLVCHAYGSLDD